MTMRSINRLTCTYLRVLDKAQYSAFESTLNSPIVSYRILAVPECSMLLTVRHYLLSHAPRCVKGAFSYDTIR